MCSQGQCYEIVQLVEIFFFFPQRVSSWQTRTQVESGNQLVFWIRRHGFSTLVNKTKIKYLDTISTILGGDYVIAVVFIFVVFSASGAERPTFAAVPPLPPLGRFCLLSVPDSIIRYRPVCRARFLLSVFLRLKKPLTFCLSPRGGSAGVISGTFVYPAVGRGFFDCTQTGLCRHFPRCEVGLVVVPWDSHFRDNVCLWITWKQDSEGLGYRLNAGELALMSMRRVNLQQQGAEIWLLCGGVYVRFVHMRKPQNVNARVKGWRAKRFWSRCSIARQRGCTKQQM